MIRSVLARGQRSCTFAVCIFVISEDKCKSKIGKRNSVCCGYSVKTLLPAAAERETSSIVSCAGGCLFENTLRRTVGLDGESSFWILWLSIS